MAEQELPLLSPDTRAYLEPSPQGSTPTSRTTTARASSLEYAVLGLDGVDYTPEKWTPVDSLAWLKAMAWDLGGNITDEIDRSLESIDLTREQIARALSRTTRTTSTSRS